MEYLLFYITKSHKILLGKGQIAEFHRRRQSGTYTIKILTILCSISMDDKNENGKRPASEEDDSETEGKLLNKYKLNTINLQTQSLFHAITKRIPHPSPPLFTGSISDSVLESGDEREGGNARKRTKSERGEEKEEEDNKPASPAPAQEPPTHQSKNSGKAAKMTLRNARVNHNGKTLSKTRQKCCGAFSCALNTIHPSHIYTTSTTVLTDMEVEETPDPGINAGGGR